jgi:hypothetical protein
MAMSLRVMPYKGSWEILLGSGVKVMVATAMEGDQ